MFPTLWRATADTQCSILRNAGGRRRAPRARVVAALVLQRGRHERRQRQRRMMGVGAVVKRFELLGARIDLADVEVARLLRQRAAPPAGRVARLREGQRLERVEAGLAHLAAPFLDPRSEDRRVGKECGRTLTSRVSPY